MPVSGVEVPDRTLVVLDAARHEVASVAGVRARVPLDLGRGHRFRPTVRTLGAEVVGDGEGGARTEDASGDEDGIVELHGKVWIEIEDLGVVPGGYFGAEYLGEEARGHV